MSMNLPHKSKFPTVLDIVAAVGMFLAAQFICGAFLPMLRKAMGDYSAALLIVYSAAMLLTIAAFAGYKKLRDGERGHTHFFFIKYNHVALMLWGIIATIAVGVVIEPLVDLFPKEWYEEVFSRIGLGQWTMVMTVVAAPVLEEIFFRGQIQENAMRKWGPFAGLFIAAAIFGVIHGIPQQIVGGFFIGLVLGYVYMRTHSLMAVIVIHAVNNAIAYLQMSIADGKLMSLGEMIGNRALYNTIYWSSAALCLISLAVIISTVKKQKRDVVETN